MVLSRMPVLELPGALSRSRAASSSRIGLSFFGSLHEGILPIERAMDCRDISFSAAKFSLNYSWA